MKDGGPAFPMHDVVFDADKGLEEYQRAAAWSKGMSLRDYFAAMALEGAMANVRLLPSTDSELEHLAMRVYKMADAMLAEREKP